jgi:glycosyltransferase involved in cell wall biosynthesis
MKIRFENKNLLIISLGYPFEDIQTSNFVKAQVDELKIYFNKVFVISPTPYFPKFFGSCKFFRNLFRNFSRVKNYTYDNVEVFFPKYFTLPLDFFRKRNGTFAYKAALNCILQNGIDFSIIHAHFIWPSGCIAENLKRIFKKKLVVTGHGFDVYSLPFKGNFWKQMTLSVLANADSVITVSKSNSKHLVQLGFEGIIKVIPNGFCAAEFFPIHRLEARRKLDVPTDRKIILTVGNLVKVKNQQTLIKAVHELHRTNSEVCLYIVGGGDLERSLNKIIFDLEATDYIKLVGSKPHGEIPLWMNAADVFVLPSFSESFGIVLIEALACGIPVISTVNGGAEEIIISDDFGFLQENPEDFMKMSELIIKSLNSKWNSSKMVAYTQSFSWSTICERIIDEYITIID